MRERSGKRPSKTRDELITGHRRTPIEQRLFEGRLFRRHWLFGPVVDCVAPASFERGTKLMGTTTSKHPPSGAGNGSRFSRKVSAAQLRVGREALAKTHAREST